MEIEELPDGFANGQMKLKFEQLSGEGIRGNLEFKLPLS